MVFSLKAMGAVGLFGLFMAVGESHGQSLAGFDEPQPSTTAFGTTGLLQSPSARFSKAGTVELGGFFVEPYRGFTIRAQPLPWLEANFRVTDITNVAQDGTVLPLGQISFLEDLFSLKGGGTRRQRGFDLKIRLLQEGDFLPAVALGGQDLFGDADFGGEYLVASKRFGSVDITFGLGWGYFGSRGHIGNPLDSLDDGFRRRSSGDVRGSFNFGNYFSGNDLAFFGGVEWHTPIDGFSVKFDYSGADPERAPLGNRFDEDFPINMGVNYRPVHWLDMALGFERGNTLSARMAVRFDLFDLPRFYPRDGRQGAHPAAGAPLPEPSGDEAAGAPKPAGSTHRRTNDLVLELSAFLRRAGYDTARISADANAVYVAITSPMAGLGPMDEQALARAIFEAIPLVIDQLWLSFGPEKPSDARLYQRDEDHGRAAGAVLALVDGLYGADEGYAATIRLADGVALYDFGGAVNGDMAFASAPPDPLLLALPDDLYLIKVRSFADGFAERDFAAQKAMASARAIMMATADAPVSSLRIEGRTRATVQIDAADGSRIDGALLSQRLDVAESLVMASGYDNQTALEAFAADFFARMAQAGIRPRSLEWLDGRMTIWIDGGPSDFEIQRIGRIARDLARHGTEQLEAISIRRGVGGHDAIDVQLLRRDVVRAVAGRGSAEEIWLTSAIEMEPAPLPDKIMRVENDKASPFLEWGVAPVLIQHIGDQESGTWLADLSIDLLGSLDLAPGLQLSGAVRRFIAGNLDQISPASSSSDLPVVRSDVKRFIENGRTSIPYLQADWRGGFAPHLYGRVSAGIFEQIYAGLSTELLYRNPDDGWSVGGELNWLKRRDEDQLFGLEGRDSLSGEISLYREWASGVLAVVRAGRFLAGDWGGSVDLSRRFANGVRIGGYLALSDGSDREFGGTSPDKGVYITIPLGGLWPFGGPRRSVSTELTDLARDSAQRLRLNSRLYDYVAGINRQRIYSDWPQIVN